MCGIVGVLKLKGSGQWQLPPAVAARMMDTLRYRGPDGQGQWTSPDGRCWLGHTRLAIVDLAGGHQPMGNEDASVCVTFNGEIYNHLEIHQELEKLGHRFQSRCDTEVLVHGYEQWGGDGLVDKLRGMFAFAIYDTPRRRLFLARDRLGIKPLYWWSDGEVFLFASEIKSILAYPKLANRRVESNALAQFLTFRYVPAPLTMFQGIYKLPAGHFVVLSAEQAEPVTPRRYWDVSFARHNPIPTFDEAIVHVDELLRQSVHLRLMSDVPLGAQLSGGVDSSLVVAHMERLRKEAGNKQPVQTFSIGFMEPGYSELQYARQIAHRYHTNHHELIVTFNDFADQFARMCWVYDEPISEPPAIPTYLLCRFAKQRVSVMLTGEGGDELFAGYPKCAADLFSSYLDWMPAPIRCHLLRGVASLVPFSGRRLRIALENLALADPAQRYASWFSAFDSIGLPQLLRPEFRQSLSNGSAADRVRQELAQCDSADSLDRMLYTDLHTWLVDDLLIKGDRMSMASGVEARVPLLDHKLVEYAAGLPPHYKAHGRRTKILLKTLAERYVPRKLIYRRKVGFAVPLTPWFLGPLRPFLRDMLLSDRCLARGYYRPEVLRTIVEDHLEARVDRARSIWSLLAIEIWHRLFVDDDGTEAASERLREQILAKVPIDIEHPACAAPPTRYSSPVR